MFRRPRGCTVHTVLTVTHTSRHYLLKGLQRHSHAILSLIMTAYLRASILADNFDDLVRLCSRLAAPCEVEYALALTGLQQGHLKIAVLSTTVT